MGAHLEIMVPSIDGDYIDLITLTKQLKPEDTQITIAIVKLTKEIECHLQDL